MKINPRVKIIAAAIIFTLLVTFAVQNLRHGCHVNVLFWRVGRTPLSIIIFFSILIGVAIASAEFLPRYLRMRRRAMLAEEQLSRLKGAGEEPPSDT